LAKVNLAEGHFGSDKELLVVIQKMQDVGNFRENIWNCPSGLYNMSIIYFFVIITVWKKIIDIGFYDYIFSKNGEVVK